MIMREWRGRVPAAKTEDYIAYLEKTGFKEYAATPGHRATWLLLDRQPDETEFVLLTLWESAEAIKAFAGQDIGKAVYYPEDAQYLRKMPERLRHYDFSAVP